jgi:hypothetical protein
MDINAIVVLMMVSVIGLYTWRAFLHQDDPAPSALPWVPIDANKHRSFVSMTRDAGMYTERARRTAIISNPNAVYSYKGSTNGSLEWNFLTSICVCPDRKEDVCPPAPNVVFSAGDADDEICDGIDTGGAFGGYDVVDFGGASRNECDV